MVNTHGIIGWSVDEEENVEYEENGRGADLGLPGATTGKPGITVVAVRKQEPGKKNPSLVTEIAAIPTLAQGAGVHIAMAPLSSQPEAEKVIFSDKHAVFLGGYAKEVFEFMGGKWEERHLAVITLMISETTMVNVFHSYGAYKLSGGLPSFNCEGQIAIETLPAGYKPVFTGSYQCFGRGCNAFGTPNVEARALDELWGKDLPTFGMYCAGEVANSFQVNPCGWNAQHKASEQSTYHSFCTCVCVFAEKCENYTCVVPAHLLHTNVDELNIAQQMSSVHFASRSAKTNVAPVSTQQAAGFKGTGNYKDYLQAVTFKDVGMLNRDVIAFWTWPGDMVPQDRYRKSAPVDKVDCFISHALSPDANQPKKSPMGTPFKYSIHKTADIFVASNTIVVRKIAEGKIRQDQAMDTMMALTYWCDIACVDQVDIAKKMHIIKAHLGDFVHNAEYICVLVSTHYFQRAWCLYEFCVCVKSHNFENILISNSMLCWFSKDRQIIADSVVNAGWDNSACYASVDREIIHAKIVAEFASVSHFDRLVKFSACALLARGNLPFGVEFYTKWYTVWGETASRCGFVELAKVINEVDVVGLRKKLREQEPDLPAGTKAKERKALCEVFTKKWFETKVAPMLNRELELASKPLS